MVEQLRSLDQAKSNFVSTVSHELRTPLTSIRGYIEMLMDGDAGELDAEQQQMLSVVERNADRLLALIEDLLTLSRIESGTLSLVSLDITAEQDTLLIDAFSARSKANQDISAFSIVDPATKRVYLAAYDQDDRYRVMGTYTHRLLAGQPLHFSFYAAALPANVNAATVDLDQLGAAKNVPVTR